MDATHAAGQQVNPLLFIVFCPHCVLSGLFALAATGTVTLPGVLGISAESYLGPAVAFGGFFAWLAWGHWSKRKARLTEGVDCAGSSCTPSGQRA